MALGLIPSPNRVIEFLAGESRIDNLGVDVFELLPVKEYGIFSTKEKIENDVKIVNIYVTYSTT